MYADSGDAVEDVANYLALADGLLIRGGYYHGREVCEWLRVFRGAFADVAVDAFNTRALNIVLIDFCLPLLHSTSEYSPLSIACCVWLFVV